METLKSMGERLRELRAARGAKQREMAERLGMTLRNSQRMEGGEINVPMLTLCALADFFEVSTDYLLGRSGEQ